MSISQPILSAMKGVMASASQLEPESPQSVAAQARLSQLAGLGGSDTEALASVFMRSQTEKQNAGLLSRLSQISDQLDPDSPEKSMIEDRMASIESLSGASEADTKKETLVKAITTLLMKVLTK